ncbi:hypothetical protein ACQP1P_38805 [Dactylosporangium sp. CA-052675]|uniref:hypothetical protein n=1 Tax=Dactylosporangium sp. CA-052675 TaxID=3239927 RepID=UPI003D90085A
MIHTLLGCLFLIIAVAAVGYWLACDAPTPAPFLRALRYRLRHDPEPFAIAPDPDPVVEHFTTAPKVVAGQDLDDSKLIAELQQAYADYRRGEDIFAGARHEPSPEVKQ